MAKDADVEIAERVVSLGRLGLGRREIALRLGVAFADLKSTRLGEGPKGQCETGTTYNIGDYR